MGIPMRNQKLLSEIGEIPEEESSCKDSIRLESLTNTKADATKPAGAGLRYSARMSA